MAALKTVDLTKEPHRAVFTGSSEEEVNYAKTFWQSIQLLPPMESRLVSSDIKQRLKKAPPSRSQSECTCITSELEAAVKSSLKVKDSDSLQITCSSGSQSFFYPRHDDHSPSHSLFTQTSIFPLFQIDSSTHDNIKHDVVTQTQPVDSCQAHQQVNKMKEIDPEQQKPVNAKRVTSFKLKGNTPVSSRKTSVVGGGHTNVVGAGGREFWAHTNPALKSQEDHEEKKGQHTDGERHSGFINWGNQKVTVVVDGSEARDKNADDMVSLLPADSTKMATLSDKPATLATEEGTYITEEAGPFATNPKSKTFKKFSFYRPPPSQLKPKQKLLSKKMLPRRKSAAEAETAFVAPGEENFKNERLILVAGQALFMTSLFFPNIKTILPSVAPLNQEETNYMATRDVARSQSPSQTKKLLPLITKNQMKGERDLSTDVQIGSMDDWLLEMRIALLLEKGISQDSFCIQELFEDKDVVGIYRKASMPLVHSFPSGTFMYSSDVEDNEMPAKNYSVQEQYSAT